MKERDILIMGMDLASLEEFRKLTFRGIRVTGFVGNGHAGERETFAGLPVYTYREIAGMRGAAIYVASDDPYISYRAVESLMDYGLVAEIYTKVFSHVIKYDTGALKAKAERDSEQIRSVRDKLADEKSRVVFDNMLQYRMTNDLALIKAVREMEHPQYFPSPEEGIISPEPGDVFLDCGAYDGSTSADFVKWSPEYSKIYWFEPDPRMFCIASEYLSFSGVDRAVPINAGVADIEGTVDFSYDTVWGGSRITAAKVAEGEGTTVRTVRIDDILGGERATYIKMDIEGSEFAALRGAAGTIARYMPKLAISIYHKDDDLWKIPYYILSTYHNYRLFIRHYDWTRAETVLYACI